jgi:hypothetical protein
VFTYTWNGIPLIYSGQEIPNHKRLLFFEKDPIEWPPICALHDFYKQLNTFRKSHPVFMQAAFPEPVIVATGYDSQLFCYYNQLNGSEMLVVLNFSAEAISFEVTTVSLNGKFKSVLDDRAFDFSQQQNIAVEPWDALIISNC